MDCEPAEARIRLVALGNKAMIRTAMFLAVFVAVTTTSGCATIAGGLIGTGVGAATGHPVSGALIGTGIGIMVDTAPREKPQDPSGEVVVAP